VSGLSMAHAVQRQSSRYIHKESRCANSKAAKLLLAEPDVRSGYRESLGLGRKLLRARSAGWR